MEGFPYSETVHINILWQVVNFIVLIVIVGILVVVN